MRHPTAASADVFLRLTQHEAVALLLLLRIAMDSYDGTEDSGEARDGLDRIPTMHLERLMSKVAEKARGMG
jgi:hypothetical protein